MNRLASTHVMLVAVSLDRRAYLCGACEGDAAVVVASESNTGDYGHCIVCDHAVFVGEHGRAWVHGEPWGVLRSLR